MSKTVSPLTDAETNVVSLLSLGYSLEGVRLTLGLTQRTIENYRAVILRKLSLDDLTQVRIWASPITDAEFRRLTGRLTPEELQRAAEVYQEAA